MENEDAYRKEVNDHFAMVMEDYSIGDMVLLHFLKTPMEVSGDHITVALHS